MQGFFIYSCRQVYQDIKPNKRKAVLRTAFLLLGFDFVLTQATTAICWILILSKSP
jgi:hypothetical protein